MIDLDVYEVQLPLSVEEFTPKNGLTFDEEELVSIFLSYLYQFYETHANNSPEEIVASFSKDIDKLIKEMENAGLEAFDEYFKTDFEMELNEKNIPHGEVSYDLTPDKEILVASLVATLETLRYEVIAKAKHYVANMKNFIESFNMNPNFKQAITKINNMVAFNMMNAKEKSHREVLNFIYGEDMLYTWECMGDMKTCRWCLTMAESPPMRLEEFPLDHPYGRCTLRPINQKFTDRYNEVRK